VSQDPRRQRISEIALVCVAAVWGLTFVMVQDAVRILPVMTFLAYRFIPAALLVALIFRRRLSALPARGWLTGARLGAFLTAGYVFQTMGLERTTAAHAGFITGLFVVLTPLLGAIFLREPAGGPAWVAAVVSAIGLYMLTGAGGEFDLAGDGLVFLCACAFAAHILATSRAVRRYDVGALLAVQLGLCGVFSLAVAGVAGDVQAPRGATVWTALVVTSVFASALAFFIQTYAQRHAPPARTALILGSEPAFAGLFAYLIQGETLTAVGWLGAGLILVAIFTVELVPQLRPARPVPEG
jgi:drug/metabolite transporter (DMT)-like permease